MIQAHVEVMQRTGKEFEPLSQRESADLYIIRALAFFDSGKYEKALKDCEKAIQLTSPKNSKDDSETVDSNTNTIKFFFIPGRVRYAMQEIQKAQKDFSIVSPAPGNGNSMWPLWAPGQGASGKATETAQQNEVMKERIRGAKQPRPSTQCQCR